MTAPVRRLIVDVSGIDTDTPLAPLVESLGRMIQHELEFDDSPVEVQVRELPQLPGAQGVLVDDLDNVDLDTERGSIRLRKSVMGALKCAITDHGPITTEWLESATKRVIGSIKTFNRQQRALRIRAGGSVESRLAALENRINGLPCPYATDCAKEFGHEGPCGGDGTKEES